MAIDVQWDSDQKTIIRHDFQRGWTWAEFGEACGHITPSMIATTDQTVHIISDFSNAPDLPLNGSALMHARTAVSRFPANWGLMVIVSIFSCWLKPFRGSSGV